MAKVLMKGNEALGEGAVIAGCRYFFGYPITPQSEVAEYLARRLPQVGGVFLQAESELAAINMVYGGAAAGARVMTGSSGPGISLKQEGISFIAEAELPCVIANISRGGPGLGGIQPAQSDYFQACKGGGHGDYHLIVLAPSSVQDMMDFALLAFDLADRHRSPVMIMSEGMLGQMMEPVEVREPIVEQYAKPWATTGCAGRSPNIVNTLHLPPDELEMRNLHLQQKYARIRAEEKRAESFMTEDAELVVVAFGLLSRVVKKAVTELRSKGLKVGLVRPITLWPFPDDTIKQCLDTAKMFMTVEINMGQMIEDVRLAVNGRAPVDFYGRVGVIPSPREVEAAIMNVAAKGGLV
ncbi:3-methyl-2-oxobutanoate dehydrogenase subunit VorB [Syntrophothermus lipocalidus]|uniref:Pyruvate flavodoxin/ferredoxin oxidoreductase domain protein n=1 Tax=Syntrophothermus lipocalidus (strain DSM 12680 / TGB-C1) TaxID=643648 RepID=D7CP92_SYNLT|nr:3-methyl-2-oxobutanoate dehydrogenase subunit VorB [Syntrophothermus lipocalidus]ADI02527.1 pyruvate flavodoxin/ferredoxin oxidoreductase domain protein [Syntrophothermus lipocalidus DSM 12680]HOV43369.1 3-methyl-2-oxobutanoate dehydrogenase subunit VorB [Syntrophothermus lipocalidus]